MAGGNEEVPILCICFEVVSNFRDQFAETLGHLHEVVLSFEVGARKPRAKFFERCRHLAQCAAGECVFIDDLEVNVAGAKACGLQGIVYRSVAELKVELAQLGVDLTDSRP